MSRNIISYEDIAPAGPPPAPTGSDHANKKRKWDNRSSNGRHVQHWDDPLPTMSAAQPQHASSSAAVDVRQVGSSMGSAVGPPEESRELTHEEIWDDSALVDAWNAAQEEYHALNGPDKSWKKEPVHKSPLWYNVPSAKKAKHDAAPVEDVNEVDEEADSSPYDFNTFVPPAGASLPAPAIGPSSTSPPAPGGSAPMVSRDEAFQNALSSMYWTGYWTAAYYYQNPQAGLHTATDGDEGDVEDEEDAEEVAEGIAMDDDDEGLLSTQR